MYHVLYNPTSGNGTGAETSKHLLQFYKEDELVFHNTLEIDHKGEWIQNLPEGDTIIVSGGDGTIHHFANDTYGMLEGREVLYFASGSGNDFMTDIGFDTKNGPVKINQFLEHLPKVEVNGKTYRFVNNVGFGIDGYCCEVGDMERATSDKPVNYTKIAIKGLLGGFKPRNAKVTIDGETEEYKKVWLAPAMNGRYYGGGMMAAPTQNRLNKKHTVSSVLFFGKGPLETLVMFPSIFKGKHVKYTKCVKVRDAREMSVEFEVPCALQIDGETFLNVTSYRVTTED